MRATWQMFISAAATVHRDPTWWRKALAYGALTGTVIGYPIAAGFIVESMDNSRRGFPTPLPGWYDWSTRYLVGLFAALIDFAFFVLPILVSGVLLFCISVGLLVGGQVDPLVMQSVFAVAGVLLVGLLSGLFLSSVAPVGRLVYARDGNIEDALNIDIVRYTLSRKARPVFWQARLASLPAYLPLAVVIALFSLLANQTFGGVLWLLLLLAWLAASAMIYAHLIVVQLYVAAEKQAPLWPEVRFP